MRWPGPERAALFVAALAIGAAFAPQAEAACPARLSARVGDTAYSIARACGLNEEALKSANPGIRADGTMQPGTTVRIPRAALPSELLEIGKPLIRVHPSQVPNIPIPGGSTVILPPEPPPLPRRHVIRPFPPQPGQIDPLGSLPPLPFN